MHVCMVKSRLFAQFPNIFCYYSIMYSFPFSLLLLVVVVIVSGGFHWKSNETKSPQYSNPLLNIICDFINAVIWIVSILHQISNLFAKLFDYRHINNHRDNHHFHVPEKCFTFLAKSGYFSRFSLSVSFTLWSEVTLVSTIWKTFFVFIIIRSHILGHDWVIY